MAISTRTYEDKYWPCLAKLPFKRENNVKILDT